MRSGLPPPQEDVPLATPHQMPTFNVAIAAALEPLLDLLSLNWRLDAKHKQ